MPERARAASATHLLNLEVAVFSCIGQLPDDVRHGAVSKARSACKL